jgi:DHA1 family purine ribonucleoside efflux pump-like MFS transporter
MPDALTETPAPDRADAVRPSLPPERADAAWTAIVSLTVGVFGLVTAEFLPASLLTAISRDLHISDGAAGQAVTATAIVGAIAAPTIPLLTRRLDRKTVMIGLTILLAISNLLAATASNLPMLLAARVALGIALGGFWSMAAALAMRLVPMALFARAMSIILTGVSLATVLAAPVGAYIGAVSGWRTAFVVAGVISLLALLMQAVTIPKLPPVDNPNLKTLIDLLRRPNVRTALLAVVLIISGHFAGFTYVRPLLEQVEKFKVDAVSLALLAYGIGGFFGNFAGAFVAEKSERLAIGLGALVIAAVSVGLMLAAGFAPVVHVAIALWGFAFGALPVGFQTWIVRAAPDQAEGAGGLLVSAFQIAIASGASLGGIAVDRVGALGPTGYCIAVTLVGAVLVFLFGPRPARS